MNKAFLVCVAVALAALPLAYAHEPRGSPKNYCEPWSEWNTHEYGPVAMGTFVFAPMDGNLGSDCDNSGPGFDPGVVCLSVDPNDPINSFFVGLCDSQLDLPAADYDGHTEFAQGGAYILAESGDGATSGSIWCFGNAAHHPYYGPSTINDLVLGAGASYAVASDSFELTVSGTGCGDGMSDTATDCVGGCTVTFPPGIDGTYQVYVTGTQGHITWSW